MNTQALSDEYQKLLIELGRRLIETKRLAEENKGPDHPDAAPAWRKAVEATGAMHGFLRAAQMLLSEDDWSQFLYRTGIPAQEVEESIERQKTLFPDV